MFLEVRDDEMKLHSWFYEKENGIAVLSRCSAEACNAANNRLLLELDKMIDIIAGDPQVRILIITAGTVDGDISSGDEPRQLKFEQFLYLLNQVMNKLERLPKPIIAAIEGSAFNLVFELILTCDIRLAAQAAKLGQQYIDLSLMPEGHGFGRLTRLLGAGRANVLAFTGDIMDAEKALQCGLVNLVVPDDLLLAEAKKVALQILFRTSGRNVLREESSIWQRSL